MDIRAMKYSSRLGEIAVQAEGGFITGLWFEGQKYYARTAEFSEHPETDQTLLSAKNWLDVYFSGENPDFMPPLSPKGSPFRQAVWKKLTGIPRGKTVAYGDIARELGCKSAQAVGGAVGHNPISIIIPCHRVTGKDGTLTGYAGGIWRKKALLELEGVHCDGEKLR